MKKLNIALVADHMTPVPYTIKAHDALVTALKLMQEQKIRHLPVESDSRVIGLIEKRDIELLLSQDQSEELTVARAMNPKPHVVAPELPVYRLASEMAEQQFSTALVMDPNGKLLGIFTEKDALRTLSAIFHEQLGHQHTR